MKEKKKAWSTHLPSTPRTMPWSRKSDITNSTMKPSTDMVGWTETNHRVAGTYGENVLFQT